MIILSNIHDDGEYHRLAMGFAVKEFGQIVFYAALELDAVYAFATIQYAHDGVVCKTA